MCSVLQSVEFCKVFDLMGCGLTFDGRNRLHSENDFVCCVARAEWLYHMCVWLVCDNLTGYSVLH